LPSLKLFNFGIGDGDGRNKGRTAPHARLVANVDRMMPSLELLTNPETCTGGSTHKKVNPFHTPTILHCPNRFLEHQGKLVEVRRM